MRKKPVLSHVAQRLIPTPIVGWQRTIELLSNAPPYALEQIICHISTYSGIFGSRFLESADYVEGILPPGHDLITETMRMDDISAIIRPLFMQGYDAAMAPLRDRLLNPELFLWHCMLNMIARKNDIHAEIFGSLKSKYSIPNHAHPPKAR